MPRDGSGVYTKPFPNVQPDTTVESTVYNGFVADVETDLNAARPVIAGGTGATNATQARANVQAEVSTAIVVNYDSQIWEPGSFYSASTATSPPVNGHAFSGIVYGPDANNVTIQARDQTDGKVYTRIKTAGVWTTAWGTDPAYVAKAGDTMSGNLQISSLSPSLTLNDTGTDPNASVPTIYGGRGGKTRWQMSLGYNTESGSNSGSNFYIWRANDAGAIIDAPLEIARQSGQLQVGHTISVGSGLPATGLYDGQSMAQVAFVTGSGATVGFNQYLTATPTWLAASAGFTGYINVTTAGMNFAVSPVSQAAGATANSTTVMTLSPGGNLLLPSDLTVTRSISGAPAQGIVYLGNSGSKLLFYDSTNFVFQDAPLKITNASNATSASTGSLQVAGGIGVAGNSWCSLQMAMNSLRINTASADNYTVYRDGSTGFMTFLGSQTGFTGYWFYTNNGAMTPFIIQNTTVRFPQLGAGTAVFDGSGVISSTSDERKKNVHGPFTRALDALRKIGGADIFSWKHEAETLPDQRYAGFVAQKVQRAIPEAVHVGPDGMLSLDDRPLIATLMNAVLELADKVERLTKKET